MYLKVMSSENLPDDDPRKSFSMYSDLASVSFVRLEPGDSGQDDAYVYARCYVRDEVKTAEVSGFTEHEVRIDIPANAYILSKTGKTIGSFTAP